MSADMLASRPWPAEPAPEADPASRMAWYSAVARWAPSKHNTQPWRFVVHDGALDVEADVTRMLPETDPHRRELVISCGAAVQLACVAARANGHLPRVSLLPEGVDGPLARVTEGGRWSTTERDRALLAAVPHRRTDRGPLDGTQLPRGFGFLLQSEAAVVGATLRLVTSPGDRATLGSLVHHADRLLVQRSHVDEELAHWLREPGDSRADGVPTDHTRGMAASYRAPFVQRDFSSEHTRPAMDRAGRDEPVIGVLCTPGDDVRDWLVAGRALAAVLLQAASAGGNASYLNQPVELPTTRVQLREQLTLPGAPQLVLRLGIGGPVTPTPRRGPDELTVRD